MPSHTFSTIVLGPFCAVAFCVVSFAQIPVTNYVSPIATTDVSPDAPPGQVEKEGLDPGGRVVSIVMDPHNQLVLYAASEMAGVWKSTNAGGLWKESNNGLRTGISITHRHALALDDTHPTRLLYLTQNDDGRVGQPLGGLWVSTDAAESWSHVDLPSCSQPGLLDAVFTGGQPFVATTNCGIATSSDPALRGGWSFLPTPPFPLSSYAIATIPNSQTLFACQGDQLFRSTSLGAAGSWTSTTLPGGCFALAGVPDDERKVLVQHGVARLNRRSVSLFDMDLAGQQFVSVGPELLPVACQDTFGSGNAAVYAVRRFDIPPNFGPGRSYEVFVADGCLFRKYELIPGESIGEWTVIPDTHVDTFAMAFTPDYSPELNKCTGYLTNDGGIFVHLVGCNLTGGWVRAMSGLHVMYSSTISGVSRPASQCPPNTGPCPTLYLPTGDNDIWVSNTGGLPNDGWRYIGSSLGDASDALIDPALPNTLLGVRNGSYKIAVSADGKPPLAGVSFTDIAFTNASIGGSPPWLGNLAQIMTLKGEQPQGKGDYVAVQSPGKPAPDLILRNASGTVDGWQDVMTDLPPLRFGPGQVGMIGVSGGHDNPTLHVLTSPNVEYKDTNLGPGQIWKGTPATSLLSWKKISGGVVTAYNMYVDPYDPNVLYTSDLGDGTIKFTNDGGQNWQIDRDLTAMATKFGEFVFDCGWPAKSNGEVRTSALVWSCPLQVVLFDRDHSNIRIVALWFGGIMFSRDAGQHWVPLLVTNDGPFDNGPPEFPFSMFYDTERNPKTGHPSLYIGLLGKSMKRVDGPLLDVVASRYAICNFCARGLFGRRPQIIKLVLDSPRATFVLHPDAHGTYRSTVLFDPSTTKAFTYHFDIDGKQKKLVTHQFSPQEQATGVMPVRGDITGCFFNRFLVWLHGLFDKDEY